LDPAGNLFKIVNRNPFLSRILVENWDFGRLQDHPAGLDDDVTQFQIIVLLEEGENRGENVSMGAILHLIGMIKGKISYDPVVILNNVDGDGMGVFHIIANDGFKGMKCNYAFVVPYWLGIVMDDRLVEQDSIPVSFPGEFRGPGAFSTNWRSI